MSDMQALYRATDGGKLGASGLSLPTWSWDAMSIIDDARAWRIESEAKSDGN